MSALRALMLEEHFSRGTLKAAKPLVHLKEAWPERWSRDALARAHLGLDWGERQVTVIEVHQLRYLDETTGEFGSLNVSPRAHAMVMRMPPIPPEERAEALDWPPHPTLDGIPPPPPGPALRGIQSALEPILVVGASRVGDTNEYLFYLCPWADYAGCRIPLAEKPWQERIVLAWREGYVCVHRDIASELKGARRLAGAELVPIRRILTEGPAHISPVPPSSGLAHREHFRGGAEVFTALLASLLGVGFSIDYDPDLPFSVLPPETRLAPTFMEGETGWTQFELGVRWKGGEINILPIVLEGLQRKAFSLTPQPNELPSAHWLAPITPERFLPLPLTQLREWLGALAGCEHIARGRPALTRSQALALGERFEQYGLPLEGALGPRVSETLAALRDAYRCSVHLDDPPSGFRGILRPYQREGLRWLQALREGECGGILADDMGLGKSVQVIAHLACEWSAGRLIRPALIVVPTSLIFNWLDELGRFAPNLRSINFSGARRAGTRDELGKAHVIIVSYALLPLELETLEEIEYSLLVLDEAQWIKNPWTQTARAVRAIKARHRLVVSGTPLENHLGELWAHMDAVMPGYLGNLRVFNSSFRVPIERDGDDARMMLLRQRLAPFLLRRTKAQVASEFCAWR